MLLLFLMLLAAGPSSLDPAAHRREIDAWRARRVESLRREDGWLTLVGLFWLQPGENTVGSDPTSRVVLPAGKAPARLGILTLSGAGAAKLVALSGETVEHDGKRVPSLSLASDAKGEPSVVRYGPLQFFLIERGGRTAVRVKDADSDARKTFRGLESFPTDSRWRIEARFVRYDPPREISVPNILGGTSGEKSPGALEFVVAGNSCRLDTVTEAGTDDWFVIFGDETNGKETYGGGRFLYVTPPGPGRLAILDFNKAYNPPCVFTPYATCPLPPRQNRLGIRVEAGEKDYAHRSP